MIDGRASGSSTSQSSWRGVMPIATPGLDDGAIDAANAGHRGAHDREQRVDRERDERRSRADAADERQRQQEPEQRQARNGLRDAGAATRTSAPQPRPSRGEDAGRNADHDRGDGRHEHEHRRAASRSVQQFGALRHPEPDDGHQRRPMADRRKRVDSAADARIVRRRDLDGVSQATSSPVVEHADALGRARTPRRCRA